MIAQEYDCRDPPAEAPALCRPDPASSTLRFPAGLSKSSRSKEGGPVPPHRGPPTHITQDARTQLPLVLDGVVLVPNVSGSCISSVSFRDMGTDVSPGCDPYSAPPSTVPTVKMLSSSTEQ